MLDEREAAAEPTPPVALFPMDLGARTDTETLTDIIRDADEFSGGASARDSPLTHDPRCSASREGHPRITNRWL